MVSPSELILRYRKGSGEWREVPLTTNIIIGRGVDADLVVEGTGVSRHHARINVQSGGISIMDLGSSNGTYKDDVRLQPQVSYPLQKGSKFRISDIVFEIVSDVTEQEAISGSVESGKILYYRSGSEAWKELPFRGVITIGRSADCDLTVNDSKVSRTHLRIEEKFDGIWITDLGSSNGTRVDNQIIPPNIPRKINPGQLFTLGNLFCNIQSIETKTEIQEPLFELWYRADDTAWKNYQITKNMIIGRSSECDLVIEDSKASRRHVQLELRGNSLWLKDLGSRNGTRVNGKSIQAESPMMITPGQVFQIGGISFTATLPGVSHPMPAVGVPAHSEHAAPGFTLPPQIQMPVATIPQAPKYVHAAKKETPWGWVAGIMGAAMVFACICVAAISGLFIYLQKPGNEREIAASKTAMHRTQVALESHGEDSDTPQAPGPHEDVTPEQAATKTPTFEENITVSDTPEFAISPESQGSDWLIMMYVDGDDEILEYDLFFDTNEMEKAGSTDQVQIVVQLDRYGGAYTGDGDWSSTRRYEIDQDGNLQAINSTVVADIGEENMGSPNALADFMLWAIGNYPASKYVLIMSDHGSGWPGGYSDQDSGDDGMLMYEIDQTLKYVTQQTGIGQLELMGFDACLMAQIEVLTMIQPYARYAVVSEEVEPAVGWAYTSWLSNLINQPDQDGGDLAQTIVKTYIDQDQRLQDPQAREEFLAERDIYEDYPPDEIAYYLWQDSTLSAIDLSAVPSVLSALDELAYSMQNIDQSTVASARTYAQGYTSVFGEDVPVSYIDLLNFASLVAYESGDAQVQDAVNQLSQAISQAVLLERHGEAKSGSTGISIYFPNSDLYSATYDDTYGFQYTAHIDRFANNSMWDEFLEYHYTGNGF